MNSSTRPPPASVVVLSGEGLDEQQTGPRVDREGQVQFRRREILQPLINAASVVDHHRVDVPEGRTGGVDQRRRRIRCAQIHGDVLDSTS
nr:hypothetical protein [Micromonospora tarapacensis]